MPKLLPDPNLVEFQDKSYFLGILRTKMSELTTEIGNR